MWRREHGPSIVWLMIVGGLPLAHGQSLSLVPLGSYRTGHIGANAVEIVCYHPPTQRAFSVNCKDRTVDVISLSDPRDPVLIGQVSVSAYGSLPTSVSARDDLIATTILGSSPSERGQVLFFTPEGDVRGSVAVGWHPDMLSFTPDGRYVVVANEGEPSPDGHYDGEGSVSVITVPGPSVTSLAAVTVRDAQFRDWDERALPAGARQVERGKRPSQDFEPEAIAISADSRTAYVTLQENNAVAVVDLESATVQRIIGLGYQDHSYPGHELDLSGQGEAARIQCVPLKGIYQPDNIGWFEASDLPFLILANEGDARSNAAFQEEVLLSEARLDPTAFPEATILQASDSLGSLVVSRSGDTDGDGDLDELYAYGARCITILDAEGRQVFNSGSQIERLIADRIARLAEGPSGVKATYRTKRGPEPEGLAIGQVAGRTYAFVGLERDNGIVTFDLTQPESTRAVSYVHPSDFAGQRPDVAADIGPEGLAFVSADTSPTAEALLLVANEVSGSVTIYAVRPLPADPVAARDPNEGICRGSSDRATSASHSNPKRKRGTTNHPKRKRGTANHSEGRPIT
jgi:hypothetical protein